MPAFSQVANERVMAKPATPQYEFGPFQLNPAERLLLRADEPIALTPKAFDTLCYFVEHHNRLLTKDELIAQLWPDSFVEESNLAQNVSAVRRALGEKPDGGHYIETVPKRGYRFAAEVKLIAPRPAARPVYARLSNQAVAFNPSATPADTAATAEADVSLDSFSEHSEETSAVLPESHVPAKALPTKQTTWLRRHALWLSLLGLVLCVAGYFILRANRARQATGKPRLAVLPFRNLNPAPETDFLGFSLADAIITKLSYISALTVRPSAVVAAAKYRSPELDPQQVAKELKVDKLLTGTFLKEGDDLRINLQLIDTNTNQALWVQPLDLKYDRLLTVQDRVTQQVIQGLQVRLTPIESEQLQLGAPRNLLAYETYLRGLDQYQAGSYAQAIKTLEQSTALDPAYAAAWAHLGRAYTAQASFAFGGRDYYQKSQAAYEKAIALNPQEIEARIFLANLFTDTNRVEEAVPQLRTVLKTNPGHAEAHWELGYAYRFGGMLAESITEGELARQLDPQVKLNSSAFNSYLYAGEYERFLQSLPPFNDQAFIVFYRGFGNYYLNRRAQAAEDFDRAYELDPSLYTQIGKALSAGLANDAAKGLALLRDTGRKLEERGVIEAEGTYKVAQAFAVLGDKEAALRLLRRSIEGGFFCYPYFISDPLLEKLRNEADYAKLIEIAQQRHEAFKRRFF
jgi:DNA-binding winged helix-turn-helix (wHTH) protein/TolB-like protein